MSASPLPPQDPQIPTQAAEDQLQPGKMLPPEQFPWQDLTGAQQKQMSPAPVEPLPQLPKTLEQDLLNNPIDPAFNTEVFLNLYKQSAENSARNTDLEMDSVLDRVPIGKIKEYATVSIIGPNGPMVMRVPVYEHQDADQVVKKYAEAQYRTSETIGMSAAAGLFFPLKFIPGWRREHEEARAKSAVPDILTGGVELGTSLLPISLYSRIYMGLNRAMDLGEAAYMAGKAVGMTNAMRQMAGEPIEEVPGFLAWLGERAGRKSLDKMSTAQINEAVQAWRELSPLRNPTTGMYEVNHLAQPTPPAAVFESFNKNKEILKAFAEDLGYLKEGNPAARLIFKQATAGAGTGVALPATGALAGSTPEERAAYLGMAPIGAAGGAVLGAAIPGAIRDLSYFKGLKGKPAEAPPVTPDPYPDGGPGSAILRTTSYRPAGLSEEAERVVMQLEDMARLGNPEPLKAAQPLLATSDLANRSLPALAESLEAPLVNTRPNFKTLEAPTDASWFENPQQADTDQVLLAGHLAGVSDAFIVGKLFPLNNLNRNPALPLNGITVAQMDGRLVAVVPDAGQPTEKEITSSSRIVTDPYGPEIEWAYHPAPDSPVVYYKDTNGGLRIDRNASEARTGQKDWLVPGRYTGEIANQLPAPIVDAYFSDINSTFPPEKTLQTLALTRGDRADLEVLLDQELTDEKILVAQKEVQEAPPATVPEVPNEDLVKMGPPPEGMIQQVLQQPGAVALARNPKPGQHPRGRSEAYQRKNKKGIPRWAFEQLDDADKVSHLKARITEAKQNQSVYELQALNPDKLGPGTPRYNTSWSPNPSQLADLKAHYSAAINELGDFGRAIKAGLKPIKDLTPQEFAGRIEKYLNNPPELDPSVPSSEVHEYWKRFYGADTEKALTAERRRTYRAIEQFRAGVPDFANLPITGEDVQAFEDAMHQTLSNAGQQVVKGQRELLKDVSPEHAAALAHSSSTTFAAHRMALTLGNLGFRAQLRPEESLGHTRTQNTLDLWTEGAEKRAWNVYHIMRSGLDGYTTEHSDWTRKFTPYLIAMARDPAFNVELADALQSGRGLQSAGTRKFDIKTGSLPGSKGRYQFTLKEAINEFRNFHELIYPRLKTAVIARLENSAAALHSAMDEARDELIAAVNEADLATQALGNPVNKPLDLDKLTVEELDDLFTNNSDTITGRSVGKKNLQAMNAAIKRFGKFYKAYQREFKKIGEWEADKHKDPNYLTAQHEATIDDLMAQIEDENSGLYMRSLGTKLRDDITKVRRSKKPTVKDMLKIFPSYVDQALKLIHIEPAMQKIYTDSPAPGAAPRGMYLRLPTDQQAIVEDWFRQIRGERNPLEAYYSRLLVGEMKYGKHSAASRAHKLVTGKNVPAQVQANLPANYAKNPLQDLAGPAQGGVYSLVVSLGNLAIQNALDKIPVALGRLAEEARLGQMVPAIPFQGAMDMARAAGNAVITKATGRATTPPISQRMGSLNAMSDVLDDALTHPVQTLGYPTNPIEAAMRKLASLTMLGPRATDGLIRAQEYYKNYRFAKRNGYTEDEAQEYARQKTATWMVSSGMGERSPRFQQWPGKLGAPLQQFYSGRVKGLYGGAVRNVATTQPGGVLDKAVNVLPEFVGKRIDLRQPVPQDAPYGPPPEPPPAHWPERLKKYWVQQQANPSVGGLHERASSKARWASLRMLMMTGLGVAPILATIAQFTGYPLSRLIPGVRYGAPLVEFPRDIYEWAMLESKRELMHAAGTEMSAGEINQLNRLRRQLKYRWIPVVGGDIRDYNKAKANREKMRHGLSHGIYPKPEGESQPQTFGEYLEKHGLKEPS